MICWKARASAACAPAATSAPLGKPKVKGDLGKILWREEYILNARIKKFPKPYVSVHGRHRDGRRRRPVGALQPSRRDRQDETGDARSRSRLLPDVGGTWLLSHSPGEIGTYFGLTGQTMNGPDAIHAGFADAVVPSASWLRLREALTKVRPVRPPAKQLPSPASRPVRPPVPVAAMQAKIDAWFAHDRMEDIVAPLRIRTGARR